MNHAPHRRLALKSIGIGIAMSIGLSLPKPAAAAHRSRQEMRLQERAIAAFRAGRFPEAYGRFVELADLGHAEAAAWALWMYQQGPALFGREWDATPEQLSAWSARSARGS